MDPVKLITDVEKLLTDIQAVIGDAKAIVADLTAAGINAQEFFAEAAQGRVRLTPVSIDAIGGTRLENLIQLLVKYGPALYAILASIFGWPPLPPIPVPTPTSVPTPADDRGENI